MQPTLHFLLFFPLFLQSGLNQTHEQWMWSGWAGLEFRVCLGSFEVRMILELDDFYQTVVRAGAGEYEALFFQFRAEIIIYFVSPAPARTTVW